MDKNIRDTIVIADEKGEQQEFTVEALFDMEDKSYALLRANEDTVVMRLEEEGEEQYLIGISDPEEKEAILDAYEVAVEANPADGD